jgi:hypothetical protein
MSTRFAIITIGILLLSGCRGSPLDAVFNGTARAATQSAYNKNVIATSDAKKTQYAIEKAAQPTRTPGKSGSRGSSGSSSSSCIEYDPPYSVIFIKGTANVYGGVDSPSRSVKGTITGGAAGIEAKCGSYYRLKGVDWWG